MPNKPASVYAIRSKTTGKIYIGCSCDPESRAHSHFTELNMLKANPRNRTYSKSMDWVNDFAKYGKGDFELYIIESNIPVEERADREDYWIEKYKSLNPKYGYNVRTARTQRKAIPLIPGLPPFPSDKQEE
jgi:group I intron endonuclease